MLARANIDLIYYFDLLICFFLYPPLSNGGNTQPVPKAEVVLIPSWVNGYW